MKRTDLDDPFAMAGICETSYEQARQARRLLLKLDIKPGKPNAVHYKGAIQWLDDLIRRLTFED